jgi:hypothetical protein
MKKILLMLMALGMASFMANNAFAQIGWTLDQCRKHWGPQTGIDHPYLDDSLTTTGTSYIFGSFDSGSKIQKEVALDATGKVNDVFYFGPSEGPGFLKIAQLLENEPGVKWLAVRGEDRPFDLGEGQTPGEQGYRHALWIGYKDSIAVFHARYYFGKRDVNAQTWGESLRVLPIDRPF